MASKNNGGRGKKPNYKLPPDDHLVVPKIKRTEVETEEAKVAVLLSHEWSLLAKFDRMLAVDAAITFGADFAKASWEDGDKDACGDLDDYRRVVVKYAFDQAKVINDVECEIWRSRKNDKRVAAFRRGFRGKLRTLQRTG